MDASPPELPELQVPERLRFLIKACEKACDAGCCGICAFDFSAVHVASFLTTHSGVIRDSDLEEWNAEIDRLESDFDDMGPHGEGLVCHMPVVCQSLTEAAVRALLAELRACVAGSKQVFQLSESLVHPVRASGVMNEFRERGSRLP